MTSKRESTWLWHLRESDVALTDRGTVRTVGMATQHVICPRTSHSKLLVASRTYAHRISEDALELSFAQSIVDYRINTDSRNTVPLARASSVPRWRFFRGPDRSNTQTSDQLPLDLGTLVLWSEKTSQRWLDLTRRMSPNAMCRAVAMVGQYAITSWKILRSLPSVPHSTLLLDPWRSTWAWTPRSQPKA